jgi:flagellar biosynthesis repressor protein FlbT
MPLKLSVSRGEKLIINGAVVRNDGDQANLVFENQAHILRQKDILTPETAATPAARVYMALQCAYLFPERRAKHLADFDALLGQFVFAAPSATALAQDLRAKAAAGELYLGLKTCRKLIDHEAELLVHV